MIKLCEECGEQFETNLPNQRFCNRKHFRMCKVCGESFEIPRNRLTEKDSRVTCSRKCTAELRKRTNISKYGGPAPASSQEIQEKMKKTTLQRYGVEYGPQSEQAKAKSRKTSLERYGVEHHTQSEHGREFIRNEWKDPNYRSKVIESRNQTNLQRYGYENPMQNPEVRKKLQESYREKTGYIEPFANPDVRSKSKQTLIEKYGVEHPLQSDIIMSKLVSTNNARYGYDNPMQNINVQRKVQSTCLERYGNTCYLQSDLGRNTVRESINKKYGVDYFPESAIWKIQRMQDPSKIDELIQFEHDPKSYILTHYSSKPSIRDISFDIGVCEQSVGQYLIKCGSDCQELVSYVYSYMEDEVYNMLKVINPSVQIIRNTRSIISPHELDLYLPEYKIAIECNPTSTHNSTINTFDPNGVPTPYSYHKMKTDKCKDAGILLFHIFGSEWTYSRAIVESMLRNLIGCCRDRIYARSCIVREVDSNTTYTFLNTNHRQGQAAASIRLGLYYNNELVSLMTFGKMRKSIGTSKNEDLSDCWELVRFCSKLNTSVVGGASKLFKYFINHYDPKRVRSFSDRAHTKGTLYQQLGFAEARNSDPGYVWVDSRTDISYHRYNAQKQNMKKFLHDDNIDLTKTEKQIMEEHGFVQVFDSGTTLWEWSAT